MNNINQKNEIISQKRYSDIPYKYAENISYSYSQNINSTIFNNTTQQLLDNDLYVENSIRDYAVSQVGPKSPDYDAIYNAYDGYKVLSDDGTNFYIYRKEEEKFGSKISCILEMEDVCFSFMYKETLFVGTKRNLQYVDINGRFIELLGHGTYDYDIQENNVFFATDNGVYTLKSSGDFSVEQNHEMEKVDNTFNYQTRSVWYDIETQTMFVGTTNSIYEGKINIFQNEVNFQDLRLEYVPMKKASGQDDIKTQVNGFSKKEDNVVVATNLGLYKQKTQNEYKNYRTLFDGLNCKLYEKWNETNFFVTSEGESDSLYSCNQDYQNIVQLSSFNGITCLASQRYLYIGCSDGLIRYDGKDFYKYAVYFPQIVDMQTFDINGTEQIIVATNNSLYHVGNLYDQFLLDSFEDQNIKNIIIHGGRLYVGTDKNLYVYILRKERIERQTSRINSLEEIRGAIIPEVSAIIGKVENFQNMVLYTENIIYDVSFPGGKLYESDKKIIKVIKAKNFLAIISKNKILLLGGNPDDESYMVAVPSPLLETIEDEDILDAVSTNNLIIVRTNRGNAYKYQLKPHDQSEYSIPEKINLGNYIAEDIASYGSMVGIKIKDSSSTMMYFNEAQLPQLVKGSADYINKIRYENTEDLVYASTKNGLVLSSPGIGEFSGEPCILNGNIESLDSIVFDEKLYNCTTDGITRYQIRRKDGYVIGVQKDEEDNIICEKFLNGKRIVGIIEHDGTVVAGGDGGIYTLSNIITDSDDSQSIGNMLESIQEENEIPQFIDTFTRSDGKYVLIITESCIRIQKEGSYSETYIPWDFNPNSSTEQVQVNDVIFLESGERREYCIATDKGFAVLNIKESTFNLKCFYKLIDGIDMWADNVKCLLRYEDDIILVYESIALLGLKRYIGGDNLYDINTDSLDVNSCLGAALIENRIYLLATQSEGNGIFVSQITNGGEIGTFQETTVSKDQKTIDINNFDMLFHDNETMYARYVDESDITRKRICKFTFGVPTDVRFDGDITDWDILEKIPSQGRFLFRKENGKILSLYNREENILPVRPGSFAVLFQDIVNYGKSSRCSFVVDDGGIKFIQNHSQYDFVHLGDDDENDNLNVSMFCKQFGVTMVITPNRSQYTRKQYSNSLYDISHLGTDYYTNLFKKRLIAIDFGFSYVEETKTAYVFGRNLIYSWGANSKDTLLHNANLYQYQNISELETDIKQIIYIKTDQETLLEVLKIDRDSPGLLYITNKGVYQQSSSNEDVGLFRLDYSDHSVGKTFSTADGIVFQKKTYPYNLMINSDGAQSTIFEVGFSKALPSGIQQLDKVESNCMLRLSSGNWFYYINETQVNVSENKIKGFFQNADIPSRGIFGENVAFTESKILKIKYETIYGCELLEKSTLVHNVDVVSNHRMLEDICFVVDANTKRQIIDRNGHLKRFIIGETIYNQFDDIIPIDGSNEQYFIINGFTQYFLTNKEVIVLQIPLEPMTFACLNGKDIISLSQIMVEIFEKYGEIDVFEQVDMSNINITEILKISDQNFVLCSIDGLYRYSGDSIYKISDFRNVLGLIKYELEDSEKFICGMGNVVMQSKNCKKWEQMFSIPNSSAKINDIYVKNRMEYFMSTTNGLYKTLYSYRLVNDYDNRNEFEMRGFVQGLSAELESTYQTNMDKHMKDYHSPDTDIEKINNTTISVNLETPSEDWCNIQDEDEYTVENDMVYSMDFGDSQSGVLRVDIDNYLGQVYNVASEYIQKNYMGGMTELFIHIDTTNNYYMNFMDGTPNCTSEQASQKRNRRNLESASFIDKNLRDQNSIVSEHCTTITVTLNGQVFDIQQVIGVEINGCSLPLKIYKDTISPINQNANNLFGGLIVPSVFKNYNINSQEGHTFTFCCFGTDEQSIKITFIGNTKNTAAKFVTVKFDANGGSGTTPSQKILLDTSTTLRSNLFSREDYSFSGWSFYIPGINQKPTFKNNEVVMFDSNTYTPDSTVTLYAVWSTQQQSEPGEDGTYSDGSQILLNTEQNEQIQIVYTEDGETVFKVTNV